MAAARDLGISPLPVGGMIDRAVAVTRRHFGALFTAMLVVQVPAFLAMRLASGRVAALLEVVADPAALASRAGAMAGAMAAMALALILLQFLATGAAAAIVAPSLGGGAGPAAPSLARRALAGLTGGLAQALALGLAPALGALPGLALALRARTLATSLVGLAAALLGALLALLAALLRTILAPAVAGVEGAGGLAALRRSARLMAPRRGQALLERPGVRASLLLLATFALALAVNGLASLPRLAVSRLAGGDPLGLLPGSLPLPLELGLSLFEVSAGAALQPFSLTAIAVFYFERRARAEGLDLERWCERLEASP